MQPRSKLIVLLGVLVALGACTPKVDSIEITKVSKPTYIIKPEEPTPPTDPNVEIVVLTPETAGTMLENGTFPVIWGYTTQDYLSMGTWLEDIYRYNRQLIAVIRYYQRRVGELPTNGEVPIADAKPDVSSEDKK